jgi:hypothetical protein
LEPPVIDDVPDLIAALAERFSDYGIGTREAISIAVDLLEEAMEAPELFELQTNPFALH